MMFQKGYSLNRKKKFLKEFVPRGAEFAPPGANSALLGANSFKS